MSVKEKTTQDLENDIKKLLVDGGYLINPNVTVRLLNAKVTILGEVKMPGTFSFTENNISLLQALGLAGDLTINGSREDVVVLRRVDGLQTTARINLTSANFLSGPYQMVKPNDVIVVNPNSAKVKTAGYVGNISAILGITSIILTSILLFTRYIDHEDANFKDQSYLQEEDAIDIKKEAGYYLFFWPYFLAGIIIAMVSAFLYLKTADRIYTSSAQLQIKKPAEDAASFLTGGMEFFGFDQVNVENDIAVLTSQHILSQVVTRLDLQTKIYTVGRVNAVLHFNDDITRFVDFKTPNSYLYWDVEIANQKASFTRDTLSFSINRGEVFSYKESEITLHDSLYLQDQTLIIERQPLNDAVAEVRNNLTATAASKQGEIINLNFVGVNKLRNEAVLNTVMQVMQDDQVEDKRLISKVSLAFINDRLDGLTKSIDTLSQNTIAYQMANGIFDPVAQTGNALSNIVKGQEEAFGIGIQLEIAKALLEKLESHASYQILPANIGIDNESVNTLVNSYNTVVTQRNNLLISATTKSPMVMQLSSQLDNAKEAIITGVNRYIEGLQTSLSGFQNMEAKTKGIVAGLPSKENTLRAYARDFKIVEELYVFLLERKEEASISYISALPNIKLLSYGVSSRFPISPKSTNYIPGCFITRYTCSFWYFLFTKDVRHQN